MNFMRRGNIKIFRIIINICMVLFIVYKLAYMPVKYGITDDDIDTSRDYIICEHTSVTNFWWAIIENNCGTDKYYVKLKGIDPDKFITHNLEWGHNKYIFYGSLIENDDNPLYKYEDYATFYVVDWEIFKPIKREDIFIPWKPSGYLYRKDFLSK